jgi:hypothetical protein
MHVRRDERDTLCPPVDLRVEVVEPRHAEDGIIAREWKRHEVECIGIRSDTDHRRLYEGSRCLLTTISERDDIRLRLHRCAEPMASDEMGGDEVTSRTAVEQYDGGLTSDDTVQLDELTRRVGELVDLRVVRVMR